MLLNHKDNITEFPVNTKNSKILDFFKNYAKEYGKKILFVDALILVSTLAISNNLLKKFSYNIIVFFGFLFSYFSLLLVYSF